MSAVNKLTKLLVKLGQKDLVRKFEKAKNATTKTITLPFRKIKNLQEPFRSPATKGQKVANIFLKPLGVATGATGIAVALTGLAGAGYSGYHISQCFSKDGFSDDAYFEHYDEITKGMYVADRSIGVAGGIAIGTAIAGPIGGLLLGGAALAKEVTPLYDCFGLLGDSEHREIGKRDCQRAKKALQKDFDNIFSK